MTSPIFLIAAAIFYSLLVFGAVFRIRNSVNYSSLMQLLGLLMPVIPIAIFLLESRIAPEGFSQEVMDGLLILYAASWITMALGYFLEGYSAREDAVRRP